MEDLTSGNPTLNYATQATEPNIDSEKISGVTSPLISGRLTPQIVILLIIMCGARLSEKPTKIRITPKMNW